MFQCDVLMQGVGAPPPCTPLCLRPSSLRPSSRGSCHPGAATPQQPHKSLAPPAFHKVLLPPPCMIPTRLKPIYRFVFKLCNATSFALDSCCFGLWAPGYLWNRRVPTESMDSTGIRGTQMPLGVFPMILGRLHIALGVLPWRHSLCNLEHSQ
jgi:hypothetical protein